MSAIGDAIQADRDERRLSQAVLARILGVSQQVLSRWESGINLPRGHRVDQLVELLGHDSRTGKLVKRLREIEPATFESAGGASPLSPEARQRLNDRSIAQADIDLMRHAYTRDYDAPEHPSGIEALPRGRSDLSVPLQFARATEQVARATALLGRCADQLAIATRMLQSIEASVRALKKAS